MTSPERQQAIDDVIAAARTDPPDLDQLTVALDAYAMLKFREDYEAQAYQEEVAQNIDEPRP